MNYRSLVVLATSLLVSAAALAADKIDPRLAAMKTVQIVAQDSLEADQVVAACLATHVPDALPLTVVTEKGEADVVLTVKARLAGDATRQLTGALGSVQLWATTPDGAKLWNDFRSESLDRSVLPPTSATVPCMLADIGIKLLRNGMKKARDGR